MAMIKAIFFTRFLEKEGTRVIHQVPPGSIVPSEQIGAPSAQARSRSRQSNKTEQPGRPESGSTHLSPSPVPSPAAGPASASPSSLSATAAAGPATGPETQLLDFAAISDYLIPRWPFCDQPVSVRVSPLLRVLGHPVCIEDEKKYGRGKFIFNLAVVVSAPAGSVYTGAAAPPSLDDERDRKAKREEDEAGNGAESDRRRRRAGEKNKSDAAAAAKEKAAAAAASEFAPGDIPGGLIAVISKLARLLRGLEELTDFLSNEDDQVSDDEDCDEYGEQKGGKTGQGSPELGPAHSPPASVGAHPRKRSRRKNKVHALCEMIMEDLNNYSECMIPIDGGNTINLKLFTPRPPPPAYIPVTAVPILTTNLPIDKITNDLTIRRLLPHLAAGIHPASELSNLTGLHISLVRRAIQHLLYYDCAVILDTPFSFSASYGATPSFSNFLSDKDSLAECMRYVMCDDAVGPFGRGGPGMVGKPPTQSTLVRLYCSLVHPRRPVREWVQAHVRTIAKHGIDVRRFVVFGILQGFLYCARQWAVVVQEPIKTAAGVISLAEDRDPAGEGGPAHAAAAGAIPGGLPQGGISGAVVTGNFNFASTTIGGFDGSAQAGPAGQQNYGGDEWRLAGSRPQSSSESANASAGGVQTPRPGQYGQWNERLAVASPAYIPETPSPPPPPSGGRAGSGPAFAYRVGSRPATREGVPAPQQLNLYSAAAVELPSSVGSGGAVVVPARPGPGPGPGPALAGASSRTPSASRPSQQSTLSAMLARYDRLTGVHPVDRLCARWSLSERDLVWWLTRQQQHQQELQLSRIRNLMSASRPASPRGPAAGDGEGGDDDGEEDVGGAEEGERQTRPPLVSTNSAGQEGMFARATQGVGRKVVFVCR